MAPPSLLCDAYTEPSADALRPTSTVVQADAQAQSNALATSGRIIISQLCGGLWLYRCSTAIAERSVVTAKEL